jgi:NAD(P)-dependent dehydrogenase (short-subunit alcohol dehydrogenase family)
LPGITGAAALQRRLDERGIEPDILINNAAFGLSSAFIDQDPERLRAMLQLDVMTLTELAQVFGKRVAMDLHHLLFAGFAGVPPAIPCPECTCLSESGSKLCLHGGTRFVSARANLH